jgi:uncharacterized coiled-coil protein SlyX
MQTDERITALEERLAQYDALIAKLRAYARLTTTGRVLLKALGIS